MRAVGRVWPGLLSLILALCLLWLFMPLTWRSRVFLSALILASTFGYTLWYWLRLHRHYEAVSDIEEKHFPPDSYAGAVVLVCGDSALLFGNAHSHETAQGWYLHIRTPEMLLLTVQRLALSRPALLWRVSVMIAAIPECHRDGERYMQTIRRWHRAISQCHNWLPDTPPVWGCCYLNPPDIEYCSDRRWFTLHYERQEMHIWNDNQGNISLQDWSAQPISRQSRFSQALWLNNGLRWAERRIFSVLKNEGQNTNNLVPVLWTWHLSPFVALLDNDWQREVAAITSLTPNLPDTERKMLPFPDALLPLLPQNSGLSFIERQCSMAGIILVSFILLAMLTSFINNQRLVQHIYQHLLVYQRLSGTPSQPNLSVQKQLQSDIRILESWQREGVPVKYALGMYQGDKLLPILRLAVKRWASSPPVQAEPKRVRLSGMALFEAGKTELKSGSASILNDALFDIKARKGWLIVVSGYTDNTGNERLNQLLSLRRARAVRDWMISNSNIPASCFAAQGLGSASPIASNDSAAGRAENRRIEITLIRQTGACQTIGAEQGSEEKMNPSLLQINHA
ncbi:OmpA family protein [Erwinia sp. HR93]|uniref:OmpA family protein n=1 Tax=Erwinia sp. HR93 TaxID=3094840 RepID=UPI002ADEB46D|nr:OmpA family protein [Erwinia sp. HR93]MEA1065118.1 OmpA family protein [Erwinia sp. HR93]